MNRRSIIQGGFAALTLAMALPLSKALAQTLTAKPRFRVIIDNDFSGDPDGLFQLAHHLASPSVSIAFIIGSHIHVNDFLDGSTVQADNAVQYARALMATMRLPSPPEVIAGRNSALTPGKPESTPAVRKIIAEARRTDTSLPLFYTAGAGLTDLAEALMIAPDIAAKMKLIWIGGPEHDDLTPTLPVRTDREYNLTIDLPAAQHIFNNSNIEIWQIPRNIYRTLLASHAELEQGLRDAGALGRHLLEQTARAVNKFGNLGETYILGDSPLVTLTALQSSFDANASSSSYVVRPTPQIGDDARYRANPAGRPMRVFTSIDNRLTFADMMAKLRAISLP